MTRILCPRASGVLAALGLVVSERRRDAQRSVLLAGDELTDEALAREAGALAERAREQLGDAGGRRARHRGAALPRPGVRAGRRGRRATPTGRCARPSTPPTRRRYGYRDAEGEVELVTLRATATEPGPDVDAAAAGAAAGRRRALDADARIFGGEEHEATVLAGEPEPGTEIEGPALVELPESTLAVPPGWAGEVLESGTIRLERAS